MSDVDGTVVALQGNAVSNTAPNDQEVLTWDATAGEWQPKVVQAMEPWIGTPNTQRQLILKRVPFVVSLTRTSSPSDYTSTGISYDLPSEAVLSLQVHSISKNTVTVTGAGIASCNGVIANIGGTLTSPHDITGSGKFTGTGNGVAYELDISGTVATLMVGVSSGYVGDVFDVQGYVDMMVM
jgi:hypothetical protein